MRKKRPCRVCGNTKKGELNRHHLIEKQFRIKGSDQITIKLCKDEKGCRTHRSFHQGDMRAARKIRHSLSKKELVWMVGIMGREWVDSMYPLVIE